MITNVYTIYDKIAMESAHVFHHRNHASAARAVAKELVKQDRPEDFKLLFVGTFDHDKAKGVFFDIPEEIDVAIPKQFPDRPEKGPVGPENGLRVLKEEEKQ